MAELGKVNQLQVIKHVDFGVFLDGEALGEILLPGSEVPDDVEVGDSLKVFVYLDSNDLPIATITMPLVQVGQCAYLKVVDVNEVGAFVDWGLPKDLLVPFAEQFRPMEVGRSYVVYLYLDPASDRIVGSRRLNRFVPDSSPYFKVGQQVELLISGRTDLGYKAIVDQSVMGLLFESDAIKPVHYGQTLTGYIKCVRADNKLDLCLQLVSREALDGLAQHILSFLEAEGGRITLTDKSSPEAITAQFGVSKSSYKKALGKLYQKRLILIEKHQITLVK